MFRKLLGYIELLCEIMKEGLRRIITRYKAFDLHIKIRQTSVTVCYAVLQVFKKEMERMLLHKTEGLKDLDKVSKFFILTGLYGGSIHQSFFVALLIPRELAVKSESFEMASDCQPDKRHLICSCRSGQT